MMTVQPPVSYAYSRASWNSLALAFLSPCGYSSKLSYFAVLSWDARDMVRSCRHSTSSGLLLNRILYRRWRLSHSISVDFPSPVSATTVRCWPGFHRKGVRPECCEVEREVACHPCEFWWEESVVCESWE